MPHRNLVSYIDQIDSQLVRDDKQSKNKNCTEQIASKSEKIGLVFAGQGFDFMAEIENLYLQSPAAKEWRQ